MMAGSDMRIKRQAGSGYIYGADILRFAAAVLVAMFHLTWLNKSTSMISWFGWIGVEIFFVLSGFVIARSASNTTPMRFVKSRILRLYPAAWVCTIISFLVVVFHVRGLSGLSIGLFARLGASLMLLPTGPFIASAYWTLPIEIMFYGAVFCILLAGRIDRIEKLTTVLCVASALYLLAYACQAAGIIDQPLLEFGYGWRNVLLLRHGIYFAFGIYLWLWSERRLSRGGAAGWALALAMAPLEITCRSAELVLLMPVPVQLGTVWLVPILIWLGACAVLVASTAWRGGIARLPAPLLRCIRVAGLSTYPLYLIHEDLGEFLRDVLIRLGCPYLVAAGAAIGLCEIVAVLIAYVLEPAVRRVLNAVFLAIGRWRLPDTQIAPVLEHADNDDLVMRGPGGPDRR